jgi:phosphotransacetylase
LRRAAELAGVDLSGIMVIDPAYSPSLDDYVTTYSDETGFPSIAARVVIKKPLGFGAAMTRLGEADAMIGGVAKIPHRV